MRTTFVTLFATLCLFSCGGGSPTTDGGAHDAPPADAGPDCSTDGTPAGDCRHFSCLVEAAGAAHCMGGGFMPHFNCMGIEALAPGYQAQLQAYFASCGPVLAGITDYTMVPLMGGGFATANACEITTCALMPSSSRPMTIGCYPLTVDDATPVPLTPACDFPSPP